MRSQPPGKVRPLSSFAGGCRRLSAWLQLLHLCLLSSPCLFFILLLWMLLVNFWSHFSLLRAGIKWNRPSLHLKLSPSTLLLGDTVGKSGRNWTKWSINPVCKECNEFWARHFKANCQLRNRSLQNTLAKWLATSSELGNSNRYWNNSFAVLPLRLLGDFIHVFFCFFTDPVCVPQLCFPNMQGGKKPNPSATWKSF